MDSFTDKTIKFEKRFGNLALLKAAISTLNKLLVATGIITEQQLKVTMGKEMNAMSEIYEKAIAEKVTNFWQTLLASDFKECNTCASKAGTPPLCAPCLHNRQLICALKKEIKQLMEAKT